MAPCPGHLLWEYHPLRHTRAHLDHTLHNWVSQILCSQAWVGLFFCILLLTWNTVDVCKLLFQRWPAKGYEQVNVHGAWTGVSTLRHVRLIVELRMGKQWGDPVTQILGMDLVNPE